MKFEFKPSFDRSTKSLSPDFKKEIIQACLCFLDLFELKAQLPTGLGLKRLRSDYWEIRKGLHLRVLFRWKQDVIEFILAGDHASIKKFLKSVR